MINRLVKDYAQPVDQLFEVKSLIHLLNDPVLDLLSTADGVRAGAEAAGAGEDGARRGGVVARRGGGRARWGRAHFITGDGDQEFLRP